MRGFKNLSCFIKLITAHINAFLSSLKHNYVFDLNYEIVFIHAILKY